MTTSEEIGQRIKKRRNELNLSQSALAAAIGLSESSRTSIAKWEKEAAHPDAYTIQLLCEKLDCDAGYLFGEYNEPRREIADIVEKTGISAKAAENLERNAYGARDALSSVLESETFWQFLDLMKTYKAVNTPGDGVGSYVNAQVEFAAKKLLPHPEREDMAIFSDGFYNTICARYCWLLMEEYRCWEDASTAE